MIDWCPLFGWLSSRHSGLRLRKFGKRVSGKCKLHFFRVIQKYVPYANTTPTQQHSPLKQKRFQSAVKSGKMNTYSEISEKRRYM